jgi:uncharacterized membrane protein YbaN (DUF454 family)
MIGMEQREYHATGFKKVFFLIIGCIFLILGVIGLIFPIMPTTPFILLSSLCFIRSSKRLYLWLHTSPRFSHIFEKKGLTARGKISILLWAWIILIIGAIFSPILWVKLLLISIGIIKSLIFTFFIRTIIITDEKLEILPSAEELSVSMQGK